MRGLEGKSRRRRALVKALKQGKFHCTLNDIYPVGTSLALASQPLFLCSPLQCPLPALISFLPSFLSLSWVLVEACGI